jgi:pimeloyl-ACP methyl ester carboxylesterase
MATFGGYADVNGLRMYYEVHGEGPPLLLLHGGTCSIERPPMGIPVFSGEFLVIAPEQMGHGRTPDATDRAFHYHDMAEDTLELLRQLKVDTASIIGLSDGGMVGLDMAIHHPDRVTRLAITGANYRTDGYSEEMLQWLLSVKPKDWPQDFREDHARLSPDGPSHWPVVLERLQAMWAVEPNYTDEQMASIKAPTLVIAGDRDMITAEHSVALFRAIPDAQLCVLPNTGHGALPMETLLAFLKGPGPR